jgi:hypothetical protein
MFLFAHLFAGAILGYALSRIAGDRRVILFCITGSILPDLVDKPLGYLLLPSILDSGRTFFHALLVIAIISAAAFLLWRSGRYGIPLLSLAAGILLHQVLDAMWQEPVTWFYPLFGPFQPHHYTDYFGSFFWLEITSASEWIFLAATLIIFGILYHDRLSSLMPYAVKCPLRPLYVSIIFLLAVLGSYSLVCAATGIANILATYNMIDGNVSMGVIALTGIVAIITARRNNRGIFRQPG